MKKSKRFSARNIILIYSFMVLIVVAIAVAVSVYFSNSIKKRTVSDKENYDRYYVMIPGDSEEDLWQSIYKGAQDTGKENGVCVDLLGEYLSKNYSEAELMEIAIASDVDGIIVYANESEEMIDLINRATDKGIPVVTVMGDNPVSKRCCFVGVGSYNMGREYGKQLVKLAREQELSHTTASTLMNDKLDVTVLVDSYSDNSNQNLVWSGIQNAVETENNTQTKINLSLQYLDNRSPFTVEEAIRDMFRSQELADVIVCLNETNTNCVYQSMLDYNKAGKAAVLGYGDSESVLRGINRNNIYFTMAVDSYGVGEDCVKALDEFIELGNTNQYNMAVITPIDKGNIEDYMNESAEVQQ